MHACAPIPETILDARSRLRVAMITETYPPEINGVAMTLGHWVTGLLARGHQVQLIRPRQNGEPTPTTAAGLEQILLPGLPIPGYHGLRMGLPARRRLRNLWSSQPPDLVHIATEGPLGWSTLGAAHELGIPVVSGFHTNFHTYSGHYGLGWLQGSIRDYLRRFHGKTRLTFVPTRALRDELRSAGWHDVEVLGRGVDQARFHPRRRDAELRRQWGVPDGGLAVAYVGRISPEKNLGLLARAFQAIEAARPDARLVLVGDGPGLAGMRAAHPRFVYQGARRGEDLARHYASADVFVFPSLTETFGNCLTEAMASGLACLAYDLAAAAEHIRHGDNGLKAPPGDEQAFIEQARWLAAHPAQLAALGEQAHKTSQTWSWESIQARLEEHYLRVIDERGAPGWTKVEKPALDRA